MKEIPPNNTITFLGTGGGRIMITSQNLATGGIWMNLDGTQILIDPGPGCIVRSTKKKLDAEKLSAIILSHRHLDHSADMNIMVEAMTRGGHNQHGVLFLTPDALGPEPVVFSYLRNYVDRVVELEEGGEYSIDGVTFTTPVRHIHRPITYGMVFRAAGHTFSYITDTRYFDDLCKHYGGELLIINTIFLEPRPDSGNPLLPTDHMSIPDAETIIRELRPKTAIITHFGGQVWRAKPVKIAEDLTEKTGVKVIAARDGMTFDLAELDKNG